VYKFSHDIKFYFISYLHLYYLSALVLNLWV